MLGTIKLLLTEKNPDNGKAYVENFYEYVSIYNNEFPLNVSTYEPTHTEYFARRNFDVEKFSSYGFSITFDSSCSKEYYIYNYLPQSFYGPDEEYTE